MLSSADNNTLDNDCDARLDVPALADSDDSRNVAGSRKRFGLVGPGVWRTPYKFADVLRETFRTTTSHVRGNANAQISDSRLIKLGGILVPSCGGFFLLDWAHSNCFSRFGRL